MQSGLKSLHSLFLFLSLFTLCLHFSWRIYNVFHFTFVTTCKLFHIKHIRNSQVWYIIIRCVCMESVDNHGYRLIIICTLQLFSFPESIYLTKSILFNRLWIENQFSAAIQVNLINWMHSFIFLYDLNNSLQTLQSSFHWRTEFYITEFTNLTDFKVPVIQVKIAKSKAHSDSFGAREPLFRLTVNNDLLE